MEPTQEELDLYAQTLCSLKTISDFLSTVKCNSDGSFTIRTPNGMCCFPAEVFNLENTLNLVYANLSQEVLESLQGISTNTLSDIQPIIDALECACQAVNDIYTELVNNLPTIQNSLDTIDSQTDQLDDISNNIDTNTDPIPNIEQLLLDIIDQVNEPYVVRIIPVTEFLSGINDINDIRLYGGVYQISNLEGAFVTGSASYPPSMAGIQTQIRPYGSPVSGTITNSSSQTTNNVNLSINNNYLVTNIQGCNQTLVKLWSDGSITDLANSPITGSTIQDNIGWCRSGIIPNSGNTSYTVIS